jgi:integrase
MTTLRLKYVNAFVDRHGKPRAYFRFGGEAWKLPMPEGSPEFMTAYNDYLQRTTAPAPAPTVEAPSAAVLNMKHSVAWVIEQYCAHKTQGLPSKALGTQAVYRGSLDYIKRKFGQYPFAQFEPVNIRAMRDQAVAEGLATSTADRAVTMVSILWDFASEFCGMSLGANPALGVRKVHSGKSHKVWPAEVYKKFYDTARPVLRVAALLLRDTSQREIDIVNLQWAQFNAKKKTLTFKPQKTERHSDPVTATVPVDGELLTLLRVLPRISDHILTNQWGKQFANSATLSRAISDHLESIGCGEYVPHGLRHTAATELADAGADTREIMAVTGLKSERIAAVYTRNADRVKAAQRAIKKRAVARNAG